jgi:hypothetical protein
MTKAQVIRAHQLAKSSLRCGQRFLIRTDKNRNLYLMKSNNSLADYQKIHFSGSVNIVQVEADSIAWGKQVLRSLNLGSMNEFEKAQKICNYLNDNFAFNFQRSQSLPEIIKRKGGNCVSHTLMGIFLLRLAGIPAKFAHEVHLTKPFRLISLYVGIWAKKANDGINSFWHNDHVWVWFQNSDTWEPFDSALDVCGFDQFYNKRFFKQKEISEGFAQKWTGPPFVIWEGVGQGFAGMENISSRIINPESIKALKYEEAVLELVDSFIDWQQEDFNKEYLPEHLLRRIKGLSKRWFKKQ